MTKKELLAFAKGRCPVCCKGQVSHLTDSETEEPVPLPEGVEGYLDDHPEGSDRGGYVPFLYSGLHRIYYYEPDGAWH